MNEKKVSRYIWHDSIYVEFKTYNAFDTYIKISKMIES